jgi:Icc-related predicted phosphoesterase
MSVRIGVISDIHQEMHISPVRIESDCDILVIAGDLTSGGQLQQELSALGDRFKNVVYVPGNHEFYGYNFKTILNVRDNLPDNVHYLYNEAKIIDGIRFVGTTLWFPNDPMNFSFERLLNDFKLIPNFRSWVYSENTKAQKFLNSHVKDGDFVVTHHLPSHLGVASRYVGSQLNRFFVSPVQENLFAKAKVWNFGHTHDYVNLKHMNCQLICNPYGYKSRPVNEDGFQIINPEIITFN